MTSLTGRAARTRTRTRAHDRRCFPSRGDVVPWTFAWLRGAIGFHGVMAARCSAINTMAPALQRLVLLYAACIVALLTGCASVVSSSDGGALDRPTPPRDVAEEPRVVPANALPDGGDGIPCITEGPGQWQWVQRVYPRSASRLTGRRPAFRWRGGFPGRLRTLEICRDAACADVVARYFTTGDTFTPSEDLPSGVLYWNVRYVSCGGVLRDATRPTLTRPYPRRLTPLGWSMRVPPRSAPATRSWGAFFDQDRDGIEDLIVASDQFVTLLHHGSPTGFRDAIESCSHVDPGSTGTLAAVGDPGGNGVGEAFAASTGDSRYWPFVGFFSMGSLGPRNPVYCYAQDQIRVPRFRVPYDTTTSLAAAGDVNDDGFGDVLVGLGLVGGRTRTATDTPLVATDVSRTFMFYGAEGEAWLTGTLTPLPIAPGFFRNDTFGYSMTGIGDFNNDGFDDVVVSPSALSSGMFQGSFGYLGSPTGLPSAPSWSIDLRTAINESLGNPTRVVGDVTGDGLVDFALPRSTRTGMSIHFFDSRSTLVRGQLRPTYELRIEAPPSNYSEPFFAVLDANGDGLQDLVVSDSQTTFALYPGDGDWFGEPQHGLRFEGVTLTTPYATADYNGDGYDDLAIGDPSQSRVLIYRGSPRGLQTTNPLIVRGRAGFGQWVM